jgi:SAM-dependent methyltransferase
VKEAEIRSRETHNRYLALVQADAERLAHNRAAFSNVPCPACGGSSHRKAFVKAGFTYAECADCETLFVNPRPSFATLAQLYEDSPSTKYWVDEFFRPMAEARRAKIFQPRASYVASRFPQLAAGRIGDIGAGFGLFLEELRGLWPKATALAIEPSRDMAAILREKKIPVLEQMLEDVPVADAGFDLLTAFELFEHLHEPQKFLSRMLELLKPGGYVYLTTLNGQGFDIQLLWEHSKSVSPPHHLNFINPRSMARLLERAGFVDVEVTTPGELDWDIVEGGWRAGEADPGRLFRTIATHAPDEAKRALQAWIRDHGFSSHLRAVARRPL